VSGDRPIDKVIAMLDTTKQALDHRLATEQRDRRVPSLVAAVVRDGVPLWSGGRGKVDGTTPTEDTQYRIGSITKTFVGVMIMRLRDEGMLSLSDPLRTHLQGTSFGDRTIGELLAHAAGITSEPAGEWWERSDGKPWADLAGATGLETIRTRAGRRFHYSNLGFAALGEVVARLRGTDWYSAVLDEILVPLGMNRTTLMPTAPHATGWAVHPWADVLLPEPAHDARGMAPAGQLWSTSTDLGKWAAFLSGATGDVLAADTLTEMREPIVVEDGEYWVDGYGIGLQILRDRGRRLAGHTGSMPGFLATVWAHPGENTGAVAMANTTSGAAISSLVADLLDIVATHEPKQPTEWTPLAEFDNDLLALTGQWYWGPAGYGLRLAADNWLELSPLKSNARYRFRPELDGTWTGLDSYFAAERLRVIRRADGSVSHLDLNTFVLTRTPYDPTAPIPGGLDQAGWRGLPKPDVS
jgi:CubicO group peptidase (beta-lactamase class C family)